MAAFERVRGNATYTPSELVAQRERVAVDRYKCPRCGTPRLNRCRSADSGTLMNRPHAERVELVEES